MGSDESTSFFVDSYICITKLNKYMYMNMWTWNKKGSDGARNFMKEIAQQKLIFIPEIKILTSLLGVLNNLYKVVNIWSYPDSMIMYSQKWSQYLILWIKT